MEESDQEYDQDNSEEEADVENQEEPTDKFRNLYWTRIVSI